MAFLPNNGDIILDAVLTETGRKRMANGNFRITKFALGDDEINYELYNKNHESGSAYYDLEILQTPVFEASTGANASINYGLLSVANNNLLYMPVFARNELVPNSAMTTSNLYYLAVNSNNTADALVTAFGGINGGGERKVLRAGKANGTAIVLETGLQTGELAATRANKTNFITANNLQDNNFDVSVDTRFISVVMGPTAGTTFNNGGNSGESQVSIRLANSVPGRNDTNLTNHAIARISAVNNNVFKRLDDNKADTATSKILGPRAAMTALNFDVPLLTAEDYLRFGRTGQTIAGAAGKYRFIDTTVMVISNTGIIEQLPIRVIEKEA